MIVQEFQKEKELLEAMQILSATITLKRWNNAINKFDIETIYINSEAVTVTNQRFNLNKSYELKHNKTYIKYFVWRRFWMDSQ